MRRDILLVCSAALLTGAVTFAAVWLAGRVDRAPSAGPAIDAQTEEIKRLRHDVEQVQLLLREEALPSGLKLVVVHKSDIPSQLPVRYANYLRPGHPDCVLDPKDVGPRDFMSWRLFLGTRDPSNPAPRTTVFLIATQVDAIPSMMDKLDAIDPQLIDRLKATPNGCLLGDKKMAELDLTSDSILKLEGVNYPDIRLELKVVGTLPAGLYPNLGVMNDEFLTASFDAYQRKTGAAHPQGANSLSRVWLRVPNRAAYERVKRTVEGAGALSAPPVACKIADPLLWTMFSEYP
jgi:hypothetical protein